MPRNKEKAGIIAAEKRPASDSVGHRLLSLVGVTLAVWAFGCARSFSEAATQAAPPQQIILGGSVIQKQPDDALELTTYDDHDVFHAAAEAERLNEHTRARALYQRLLGEMPTSPLVAASHFNLGLSFEHEQDWPHAAQAYAPIVAQPMPVEADERQTWIDAHFRRAACLAKIGDWFETRRLFETVLKTRELTDEDKTEAMLGRAIALEELGEAFDAELAFSAVLQGSRETQDETMRGFAAEAAFHSAEIARKRFDSVKLAFSTETPSTDALSKLLDAKCEELVVAQGRYVRAIRYGDAYTVAAAGNRIGGMYEDLYAELVGLEVPSDLTPEQVDVYKEEVKNRVKVLAEKAIRIYEHTALIGRRTDSAGEWVKKSEAALAKLRAAYLR
ncbi:MAG: hypothetical protein H7Z43_11520 [Clostridia bacterium]|nr:hypothetical protein [Deltaproteobacteria bacterium]